MKDEGQKTVDSEHPDNYREQLAEKGFKVECLKLETGTEGMITRDSMPDSAIKTGPLSE